MAAEHVMVLVNEPDAESESLGMSYRTNTVQLPFSPGGGYNLIKATYTILDLSITPGQDPDNRNQVGQVKTWSGTKGSISFNVGRSGSSTVANWWKNRIAADQSTFNHDPGDLNFAFIGTLTLQLSGGVLGSNQDTYTFDNVAFGQGHSGSTNNWWFGSTAGRYTSGNTLRVTGTSTSGYSVNFNFLRGGNPVDEIKLNMIKYPGYTLFDLGKKYVGENVRDAWQSSIPGGAGIFPPYVTYYNSTQSAYIGITVKAGKLYDSTGALFDTTGADKSHSNIPVAVFVVDPDGNLYASRQFQVFLIHHSTLLAGASVATAGELQVNQGVITFMSPRSGHYRPDAATAHLQLSEALYRQGYHETIPYPSPAASDMSRLLY